MALEHVSYLEASKKTEWLNHKLFFFVSSRNAVKVWLKVNTFALSVDDYDDDLNCLSSQLPFLTVSPLFSGLVLEGGFLWGAFGRKRRCLNI